MSNKAFEEWWEENEFCCTSDKDACRATFEAGQRQGIERAAEIAKHEAENDVCMIAGDVIVCTNPHGLFIVDAIRKEIKP